MGLKEKFGFMDCGGRVGMSLILMEFFTAVVGWSLLLVVMNRIF
ncbi:hypothetical protein [Niallia sp. 03133]